MTKDEHEFDTPVINHEITKYTIPTIVPHFLTIILLVLILYKISSSYVDEKNIRWSK